MDTAAQMLGKTSWTTMRLGSTALRVCFTFFIIEECHDVSSASESVSLPYAPKLVIVAAPIGLRTTQIEERLRARRSTSILTSGDVATNVFVDCVRHLGHYTDYHHKAQTT